MKITRDRVQNTLAVNLTMNVLIVMSVWNPYRIIESLKWEKTFKTILSNRHPTECLLSFPVELTL